MRRVLAFVLLLSAACDRPQEDAASPWLEGSTEGYLPEERCMDVETKGNLLSTTCSEGLVFGACDDGVYEMTFPESLEWVSLDGFEARVISDDVVVDEGRIIAKHASLDYECTRRMEDMGMMQLPAREWQTLNSVISDLQNELLQIESGARGVLWRSTGACIIEVNGSEGNMSACYRGDEEIECSDASDLLDAKRALADLISRFERARENLGELIESFNEHEEVVSFSCP